MRRLNDLLLAVGSLLLLALMLLSVINLALRPLGYPVTGTFELMGLGTSLVAASALGYSIEQKAHIYVDILFRRFPPGLRRLSGAAGGMVTALFFAAVAWELVRKGAGIRGAGEVTETLGLRFYPVIFAVAGGFGVAALNLACMAVRRIAASGEGGQGE